MRLSAIGVILIAILEVAIVLVIIRFAFFVIRATGASLLVVFFFCTVSMSSAIDSCSSETVDLPQSSSSSPLLVDAASTLASFQP